MYAETKMTGRQRRVAEGLCEQCGAERDDSVSIRMCPECLSKHRQSNRKHHQKRIDSGAQRSVHDRTMHEGIVRMYRESKLRSFAQQAGRLPSLSECAEMFGLYPSTAVAEFRRRTFGIRKKRPVEVRMVIPYPVPDQWRE